MAPHEGGFVVKKSSIFQRLKNRWRSPAGVTVGSEDPAKPVEMAQTVETTGKINGDGAQPSRPATRRLWGRKISARDDALIKLGESFKELPALGRAQLELLQKLSTQVEQQNAASAKLAEAIVGLPEKMKAGRAEEMAEMKSVVKDLGDGQSQTLEQIEQVTTMNLDSMCKAHENQTERISEIITSNGRWMRGTMFVLILTFAALISIFVVLMNQLPA